MSALPEDERSVMEAIRGVPAQNAGGRLSVKHLEQRDRAMVSLERAEDELRRLAEIERGTVQTENSPRLPVIREVIGEVGALRNRVDRTYV